MLEQIFKSEKIIQALRSGPLGQFVDAFASLLAEKGYCLNSLISHFGLIRKLSIWLQEHQLNLQDFNEKQIHVFVQYGRSTTKDFLRRGNGKTLQLLIDFLRSNNSIPQEKKTVPEENSIKELLQEYTLYLAEEKGLCETSIIRDRNAVFKFLLQLFGQQKINFQDFTRSSLLNYINDCCKHYSSKSTQTIASSLRSFIHFLVINGHVKGEFVGYIPAIPSHRTADLPEFLTQDQVGQLLSSGVVQHKPSGCRNYAILLLLVRLGLRASEVLRLSLDDINWLQGNIQIHGKGGKLRILPLIQEVGEALVTYLKTSRPHCASRQIFIRSRAPFQPLNNASDISSIVRRALLAAGLYPTHKGAHLLRYTAATESLRCGATLFEVGDLLGHCSIDTTALYTKIDITRLKELALPWPDINKGGKL